MKKIQLAILSLVAGFLVQGLPNTARAQSSADDLLDTLQGTSRSAVKKDDRKVERHARQISANMNDPFQRQLFAQVETTENLSYDMREWTNHIFAGEYKEAAHLWTAIQEQIPQSFRNSAEAAYLYSLWNLNVPQTFFLQLTKQLEKPSYASSPSEIALENSIGKDFDRYVTNNAIQINPSQEEMISKLDSNRPIARALKAQILLRKGEKAEAMLNILPPGSKIRIYLAQTAALAHARKHDLVGAAKILKSEEPSIEALHDPALLSQHYLTIARLLYQAGQLSGAQSYYEKIPNKAAQYVAAREEMTWTLLRQGDTARLRGELHTLSLPLFKERFSPEVFLVRAISNLKMCFYDSVQKDFEDFTATNGAWAKKIDQALASQYPTEPPDKDTFSQMAVNAVNQLTAEKQKLAELGRESIGATLPAVGPQKHWTDAQREIDVALSLAKQDQAAEFHRQWTNDRAMLAEAVRKMRFVKVEYLSQVRKFGATAPTAENKTLSRSQMVADSGTVIPKAALSFPVDEVLWPDELFKIRSTAQSRCLSKNGGTK